MAFFQFEREQVIQANLNDLWDFVSSPVNLEKITPPKMGFTITSNLPEKMYPGMIIAYKVNLFPFVKTTWVTEITQVAEKKNFVDEQRVGPYRMWHHQHILEDLPDGVKMRDIISYCPPMGVFGHLLNAMLIRKQLSAIFEYRKIALEALFQ